MLALLMVCLFGVNEKAWGNSSTKLTVTVSGKGKVAVTNDASAPASSAYNASSASNNQSHSGLGTYITDTYYVWVDPDDGYYCSGVTDGTWNSGGYYVVTALGNLSRYSPREKNATATFVGNSYTLTFNGNGNTSGSMENQGFVYGTAKNIKANGFTRAYTVTYQANGGTCSTASATATYTLAGWAKSANGDVVFIPGQQLKTPTPIPEHGDVIDLFAVWTPASVTLPTPTKEGFLFDGWYNGDTYVAKGGESYTPTANVTLTAHWAEKLTPQFVLDKSQVELDQKAILTLTNVNNPSINISPAGLVAYNAQNGELTALSLGAVTITVTQQAVGDIKYKQEQLSLEVIRKTSSLTLYIDGEERTSKSVVQGRKAEITYDKVSDANVVVTNVSGGSYAAYANGEITASEIGTAVFRATLPQTDTYQSTYVEFSIKVTEDLSHLPITINSNDVYDAVNEQAKGSGDRGWDNSNGIYLGKTDSWSPGNWDDKYVTIHFVGVPDKLSFKYKYVYRSENFKTTAVSPLDEVDPNQRYYLYIEESANGSDWTPLAWQNTAPTTTEQSSGDQQLKKTTRYLRFHLHANYGAYYREIKVTELKYVQDPDPANIDLGTAVINSGEVSKTTLVNWCNVAPLAVTSSNPRFTVSPTSFGGYENYGSQTLTISYTHGSEVGAQEADITLSNGNANYNKTIHVTAETTKRPQTITWNNTLVSTGYAMNVGEQYPDASIAAVATVARGARVTYTSANSNIIEVVADTALLAKGVGKVKIAAHQAGDDEYAAVSDTVEFQVTNLLKQSITWDQDLMSLLTTSGTVELNATASSNGQITYTSGNSDVVSVSGNTLTVVGEGETTITATQAGGEIGGQTYLPISLTASVYVRNPASQCNGKALNVNSLTLSSSHLTQEYTLSGVPETLTFSAYHGTKSGQWGTAPSYASLIVEQYACINDLWDWYEVYNHVVGTSATASGNVPIDASATKIRFRTGETAVDHTISGILVSMKKFMSADVESVDLNVEANSIWQQTITISHSNIDKMSVTTKQGLLTLSSSTLGDGCGDFGDDAFVVSYTPTNKNTEYKDTIVITDGKTVPSTIEIPVRLYAQALNQSINGFELPTSAKTTDIISLTATATSGLAVTYSTSNDQIAQIINENQLIFVAAGEVMVTASQIGGGAYNAAEAIEKTIVANKVTPAIVENPEVAKIQYTGTFNNSQLSAGKATVTLRGVADTKVDGTFTWTSLNETTVDDAAGSHDYSVTFTPNNGNMYAPKVFTLSVTVSRADGGIVMKDGKKVKVHVAGLNDASNEWKIDLDTIIQSKITDAVANRAGGVSYEVISANKANASIDGNNIFSATEVGTYTLRATQAETSYYTLATDDFDIVVEKVVPSFNGTDNYSMKVAGVQNNAFSFTNVETLVPHITHYINEINNGDGKVIEYDAANNKIIAHNAGTAEIYFTQAETGTNAGGKSATFHYTVTKHEPKFTWNKNNKEYYYESTIANIFETTNTVTDTTVRSNNPTAAYVENNTLHILNVEENTTFTLHQAENYYWAEKEMDVTITPKVTNDHVTFTIDGNNRNYMVVETSSNVTWDNNGYKMGNGTWVYSQAPETYIIIAFTGTPDRLTFTKTLDKADLSVLGDLVGDHYPANGECLFKVYESATNGNWGSPIWQYNQQEISRDVTDVPPLKPNTRYLKLYYYGTVYGHFNNIKVTELVRFDADKETLDFGMQGAAYGVQEMQLNFTHANAGRTTTMALTGADAQYFTVTPNVLPETGRDITGTVNFHVTFDNGSDRRGTTPYNAELVFTDNLGHEERVALTGVRDGKSVPTFTFNPNNLPYYYGSTIANVAVSTNTDYVNCRLSYSSSDPTIAYIDETGMHITNKGGEVTITVSQGEGGDFREWSKGFTFTPRERPSLHTPFVVTSSVFNNAGKSGSNCSWNSDENRVELGYSALGGFNWDDKSITLVFDGMPDSLSFQYACSASGTTGVAVWEVKESADGSTWTQVWLDGDHKDKEWKSTQLTLKESTRYLQFFYRGNFAGYWKNIKVTGIDGYAFFRAGEGQYLSRGADWSTRAIVDEYGVACRITRTTDDNTNYKTRLQFADSENYLFETGNTIYTDNKTNNVSTIYWNIVENAGTVTIQSANNTVHNGHYVTVNEDGVLAFTSDAAQATHWYKDGAAQYQNYITQKLDQQATAAAQYDFEGLTTLAAVRKELNKNEYDFNVIDVPALAEYIEQKGDYRNSVGVIQNNYEYVAEDLIPGFYKLTVQGFNRMGSHNAAYTMYANNMESSLAYIYANEVKYPMMSLFDESGRRGVPAASGTDHYYPDGYFYADDREAALVSFANEKAYLNDVYVYVNADEGKETGTLRYGIRNTSYINGAWLIYGNIQLKRLARAEFVFHPENNDKTWGDSDNWNRDDDKTPTDQSVVRIEKDVDVIGPDVRVYSLTIEAGATVTVKSGATLTIGASNSFNRDTYGNIHVEEGGKLILTSGRVGVNNLYLDASLGNNTTPANSGQIRNPELIDVNGDAYFDLVLEPNQCSPGWYDFVVPFPVDDRTGISRYENNDWRQDLRTEVNYAIMTYHEEIRANGQYAWKKYYGIMQPGKCYSISVDDVPNKYRFRKQSGAPITMNESIPMTASEGTGGDKHKGWNSVGNGTMTHATISAEGMSKVQIYDHATNTYKPLDNFGSQSFPVGTAVFVQIASSTNMNFADVNATLSAPMRTQGRTLDEYLLAFGLENDAVNIDRLYLSASEDASANYEIGHDLAKFGTSTTVAQIWADAYGQKLCDVEAPLVADQAIIPISLYAAQTGTYTLDVVRGPQDASLYLMYNGAVIWNLSQSAYTFDLTRGTNSAYSLLLTAEAPAISTGSDNISGEKTQQVEKILLNGQLYILRDGQMYDATGKKVK